MRKLILSPEEESYSVKDGEEVLSVQLDGGLGRYRKDIVKSSSKVRAKWLLDRADFEYFRAFFRSSFVEKGALPFLVDLIIDESFGLTEHTAYFVPGTMSIARVRGHSYQIQVELEVLPKDYEEGYFDAVVVLYENFGDEGGAALLAALNQFINIDVPADGVFDA